MILREPVSDKKKAQRLQALLALARQTDAPPGPCPSPNDMAAFMQGTIDAQRGQYIEAHLAVCHECYEDFLMIADISEGATAERPSLYMRLMDWLNRLISSISQHIRPPRLLIVSGLAAAAVACILLIIRPSYSPNFAEMMHKSYTDNVLAKISEENFLTEAAGRLPWENKETSLGFTLIQRKDSDASLAFGAGLWSARHDLVEVQTSSPPPPPDFASKEWTKTDLAVDYWLGRWSYLMRSAALSDFDFPANFWQEQRDIMNKIQTQYDDLHEDDKETYQPLARRLKQTNMILNSNKTGTLNRESRVEISNELDQLIDLLSPHRFEE